MHNFTDSQIQDLLYLLQKTGEKILGIYENFDEKDISHKEDDTPVTVADIEASTMISDFLQKNYPNFEILCEEKNKQNLRETEHFWVVDPIDGTKEFIKKTGEFTINIGLCFKNAPIAGFIYAPALGEVYYAIKNRGAFFVKNEFLLEKFEKIHVSNRTQDLIYAASRSHKNSKDYAFYEKNRDKIAQIKNIGSSLKGCLIARGAADIYYRFGLTSKWDICAMQTICEEAGAIVKQLDDSKVEYKLNCQDEYLNKKGFYVINNAKNHLKI